jgi:alpha-glucosidase (family GH31 glycosyl hydrolase)
MKIVQIHVPCPPKIAVCSYDNNMNPREFTAKYDSNIEAVKIDMTTEGPILFRTLGSIQISKENEPNFCKSKYIIESIKAIHNDGKQKLVILQPNNNLPKVEVTFTMLTDFMINIKIEDPADNTVFTAPEEIFNPEFKRDGSESTIDIDAVLSLPAEKEEFYFQIHELNNPMKVLYSTKDLDFVYSKYFIKIQAKINSNGKIFGLGERVGNFFLEEGVYTLWSRNATTSIEDDVSPGKNIYGTHPVYFTQKSSDTKFFAVYEHNAGAQDYFLKKDKDNWIITSFKTSGITDLYIMLDNAFPKVVDYFHYLVGKPAMVPEWGLGWHQ